MTDSAPTSQPNRPARPLPDYDHLSLGPLTHRIRSLDTGELSAVLGYEQAHGNRLPVVEVLRARLAELESGATPSAGPARGETPERADSPPAPRQVDQTTSAPTINPQSHGVPTIPAQPR
jgi:hypothetical protein